MPACGRAFRYRIWLGSGLAARTFLNNCLAPWRCGCALRNPSSAVKALARRLPFRRPPSRCRCLSRAYLKWDLPWSDHVMSECEGTTQMAVSRRSGQRGKREEPIGPFPHRRVAAASGHPTLNMAAHSKQPVHRRRGPAVTRSARLPLCRVGMNCTPPGDVAESIRLSAHRSETGVHLPEQRRGVERDRRVTPTTGSPRCG
jgi:hypothetical protein